MLALRSVLRRAARAQACASFTSGPQQEVNKVYEIRTYTVTPAKMNDCMKLLTDHSNLLTSHPEFVGLWTVEKGGLNIFCNIWEFDSFEHRKRLHLALPDMEGWDENIPILWKMFDKVNIEFVYLFPWCKLGKAQEEGVYEMVISHMKPGGTEVWGEALKSSINSQVGYKKLIGAFYTEFGSLNEVREFWWHKDADSRAAGKLLAQKDAQVVASVRESSRFLLSQKNMFLVPASFSPLK
ncbi:protein NipSnap homolog 3A-like isoform X1 [Lissotriton helveticus]